MSGTVKDGIHSVNLYMVACQECSWKIVTSDPSAHRIGHGKAGGKFPHVRFIQEPYREGYPTMPAAVAQAAGHQILPEILVAQETAARLENEEASKPTKRKPKEK